MASAKSSRLRPAGHSGVFPVNAAATAGGSDGAVQLTDKLKIFKTDNFDPDAYVQSKCRAMDEKVKGVGLVQIDLGSRKTRVVSYKFKEIGDYPRSALQLCLHETDPRTLFESVMKNMKHF